MKKVFLATPIKLDKLNHDIAKRLENIGFKVLSAHRHTMHLQKPEKFEELFEENVKMIKKSDIFVAVLKDYGKDLTAEVGMVYAWKKPAIGIDFDADVWDVMSYFAFDEIIKPEELEEKMKKYL